MSLEAELLELERRQLAAFTAWDHMRQLSASVPMGHRSGIGAIARSPVFRQVLRGLQRLRYAGVLADCQRELNLIALERASKLTRLLDTRGASVDQRMATADQRMAEVDQRVSATHDLAALVHRDVGQAIIEVHDRMDTTTSYVTYQAGELRSEFFELDETTRARLEGAAARLDQQEERCAELEEQSRLHGSHIRRLDQSSIVRGGREAAAESRHPLAGEGLPRLISLLEQQVPELMRARQVGVSIQDGAADDMIAIQAAHFGNRLGMYGTSDDAWYHVDFTKEWDRDILFENALSKLKPGGYFVLISDPDKVDTGADRSLSKVLSRVFEVTPTVRASVHVWQRPAADGATA